MSVNLRKDSRKLHRWGAILTALPFFIVVVTGLFLQVKKEFEWIQPAAVTGSISGATLPFEQILSIAGNLPELEVEGWKQIDRLDVRPNKGIIKVRSINGWEAQLDSHTGEVLKVAKRRSDLIESIHDGSWFFEGAKLWIFLPSALLITLLWLTGIYLFFYPYIARRRNRNELKRRKRRRRQHEDARELVPQK